MFPVIQNILHLKHLALDGRSVGTVPSSENKCPYPVSYGFRFQFQVDELLKDSSISHSKLAVQRNSSPKNERNLEDNSENIILAGNEVKRIKQHQKKKITKKRRIRKSVRVRRITYDDSGSDISLFCTAVLEASIAIIFRWLRKQFRTCGKIQPKLILPFYRYCHHRSEKSKCTQSCRMSHT